jgi:hypothetical protein
MLNSLYRDNRENCLASVFLRQVNTIWYWKDNVPHYQDKEGLNGDGIVYLDHPKSNASTWEGGTTECVRDLLRRWTWKWLGKWQTMTGNRLTPDIVGICKHTSLALWKWKRSCENHTGRKRIASKCGLVRVLSEQQGERSQSRVFVVLSRAALDDRRPSKLGEGERFSYTDPWIGIGESLLKVAVVIIVKTSKT